MLLLQSLLFVLVFVAFLFVTSVCLSNWNENAKKRRRRYPPSLPVLSLLVTVLTHGVDNLADYFLKKSLQLGPIFTVSFGSRLCLVLNTKEVIKEALLKQSSAYAGREGFYTETYIFNKKQKGITMRQYDADYRRYHFLYMSTFKEFGFGVRSLLESRISVEVEAMLDYLKLKNSQVFNPKDLTMRVVSNVIGNILFGRRRNLNEDMIEAFAASCWLAEHMDPVLDVAPLLRFTPRRKRLLHDLTKCNNRLVASVKEEIEKSLEPGALASFVNRVVDKEGPSYDHDQLVTAVRELTIAGSDTLTASMLWSYVLLANNPSVQKRMQTEIDRVVPKDTLPSMDDQPRLPFVEATILEIMRLTTAVPLAVPHMTLTDTELCGYFIPARSVVLPNLHAAHMNPRIWVDPEDFKPERFLDEDNNVARDSIIPFNIGRRSCLGEVLARHEIYLFIASLIQNFTIKPPEGQEKIEVSPSGTVITKPSPFELRMIPRRIQSATV